MSSTILDFRGRDLALIPPTDLQALPTPALLDQLCGPHLPAEVRGALVQDKRAHFLRTKPFYFSVLKRALQEQQTPFEVAFETRPALPFATSLTVQPRPYQEEALAQWHVVRDAGVVVLPTGAGKTLVAALAIHATGLWTLAGVPALDLPAQGRAAPSATLPLDPAPSGRLVG